ncbi:hypothetical protein HGB13_03520 [bacterium]|nr:hypothetical protein [bacterium]
MKTISWFMVLVGTISLIMVSVISVIFWYVFSNNCKDYLKLAGDAPNIERADQFLGQALSYIEKESLTNGNSAFFFHTPTNDIGIWYEQIKGAKETTADIIKKSKDNPATVSQLERDNALMKIREVVIDNSQKGTSVTVPAHITWFPYQLAMLFWWWASVILFIMGWVFVGKANN